MYTELGFTKLSKEVDHGPYGSEALRGWLGSTVGGAIGGGVAGSFMNSGAIRKAGRMSPKQLAAIIAASIGTSIIGGNIGWDSAAKAHGYEKMTVPQKAARLAGNVGGASMSPFIPIVGGLAGDFAVSRFQERKKLAGVGANV